MRHLHYERYSSPRLGRPTRLSVREVSRNCGHANLDKVPCFRTSLQSRYLQHPVYRPTGTNILRPSPRKGPSSHRFEE